jgi:hypothetical protein
MVNRQSVRPSSLYPSATASPIGVRISLARKTPMATYPCLLQIEPETGPTFV